MSIVTRSASVLPLTLLAFPHTLNVTSFLNRNPDPEIMQLRAAFDAFDVAKDGIISYAEFKQALEKLKYPEETLQEIFASVVSSRAVFLLRCGSVSTDRSLTYFIFLNART
jgi:Ca2+-binding EF-hand superfamily protein